MAGLARIKIEIANPPPDVPFIPSKSPESGPAPRQGLACPAASCGVLKKRTVLYCAVHAVQCCALCRCMPSFKHAGLLEPPFAPEGERGAGDGGGGGGEEALGLCAATAAQCRPMS